MGFGWEAPRGRLSISAASRARRPLTNVCLASGEADLIWPPRPPLADFMQFQLA